MFMQQREISKIRRSAQYYRQKIHSYRSQEGSGREDHLSPTPDREVSMSPSVEGLPRHPSDYSISEDFSDEVDTQRDEDEEAGHATPSTAAQPSTFPTYSPTPLTPQTVSEHVTREAPPTTSSRKPEALGTEVSPATDSTTVQQLRKMASGGDRERQLAHRKKSLDKRRRVAEAALKKQRELSVKERQLDREEERVNKLIDEAEGYHQDRRAARRGRSGHRAGSEKDEAVSREVVSVSHPTSAKSPSPSSSVSEDLLSSESVPEEIPTGEVTRTSPADLPQTIPTISRLPTEYADDTFESLETTLSHPPILPSSTPIQPEVTPQDTLSPTDSLKITSVSGMEQFWEGGRVYVSFTSKFLKMVKLIFVLFSRVCSHDNI